MGALTLTPGELYYLGTVMQAKYIDYAYVAAMEDIRKNYAVYESETRSALINASVLIEDFSGEMTIDEEAGALLRPVFFGEFESCIDTTVLGERQAVLTSRFHCLDTVVTMVRSTADGKLQLERVTSEDMQKIASSLLPPDYKCDAAKTIDSIPGESVTRIFSVKNTLIGKKAAVRLFVESDGTVYAENDENTAVSMDADAFAAAVLDIITEAN